LPRHQLYFGSLTPSEARRPVLGSQLTMMHPWPALLSAATQPALLALAPAVATGVTAADGAAATLVTAQVAVDKFQLDGALKQLFDAYNAIAATTFGGLKAIVHDHPELKRGSDWADSFYLHESRPQGATTVALAKAEVKRITGELAVAQQRLTDLEDKQKTAEADALATAAALARVAEARKDTDAAIQRQKDAIEEAKKTKKPKKP
jgi:hypothetical protein